MKLPHSRLALAPLPILFLALGALGAVRPGATVEEPPPFACPICGGSDTTDLGQVLTVVIRLHVRSLIEFRAIG